MTCDSLSIEQCSKESIILKIILLAIGYFAISLEMNEAQLKIKSK